MRLQKRILERPPALIAEAMSMIRTPQDRVTGLEAEQENDYLFKRECLVRLGSAFPIPTEGPAQRIFAR